MRYQYLIALAILMAMPTVSTLAEEPTADQRLRVADHSARPPEQGPVTSYPIGVFCEAGPVRFRLLSGRIEVDPMRYRKGSQTHDNDGFTESITVASSSGVPSVCYQFGDQYQRIHLIAEHGGDLRIESNLIATGERAILQQCKGGEIHWITCRDVTQPSNLDLHVSGPTLLHIVGQDESGFRIHIDGLISRMLRGRSLIDLTQRTGEFLQKHADQLTSVSSNRVNLLIDQLGSVKHSQRRGASIELTRLGTSVIPFLNAALRRNDLDVEQMARLRMLVSRCPRIDDDTPSSLACLLSTDRAHWAILSKRMNRSELIAANDHIRRCGLETLQR
jgi:hypothetical protein